ncbi:MAG TPA: hypothetical protein VFR79_04765 [Nitrospira sp.]|nr:hypothetical protein [Nitrospira sp.]
MDQSRLAAVCSGPVKINWNRPVRTPLKQVGAILKDFPEYKISVDGHTDNRPIRSELKKKFPSNKELSEARASMPPWPSVKVV